MHPLIQKYIAAVAKANGVENTARQFAVEPVIEQKMREAVRLSSDLLKRINTTTVTEKVGQIVGLTAGLTASRTDTSTGTAKRVAKSVHSLKGREYRLEQTNFDTAIRYDDLDEWAAAAPDYAAKINSQIAISKGLSLLSIGFNGTSLADTTNFAENPLLQDCGKGWLQMMREENAARVLGSTTADGTTTAAPVIYGPDKEYKSLDAVVFDAVNEMIAEEFSGRQDFVVLCASATLGDKYFTLINAAGDKATEVAASDILASTRRLGGIPAIAVPYFPKNTLLITPLANLSIYFQKNGIRRKLVDDPERDQIANYESDNIDFVVEEYGAAVLIENLKYQDKSEDTTSGGTEA